MSCHHPLCTWVALIVTGAMAVSGCTKTETPAKAAPAPVTTEAVGHETELLRLTLTAQAEQRLGIVISVAGDGVLAQQMPLHGEIVIPGATGLSAGSAADPAALAASQARADAEVGRAAAQDALARKALARAEGLLEADAGSARTRDEAASALASAEATLKDARTQRALLGPAVSALNRQDQLWVRVPVYSGDLARIDRKAAAVVRPLGGEGFALAASPAEAQGTSNPAAGTVDLYYGFRNTGRVVNIGQRVSVGLPLKAPATGLTIPAAAILHDIYGGEWVYVRTAPHSFERRRIEISAIRDDRALLSRGLRAGEEVVSAGAAELFGTEFGAK